MIRNMTSEDIDRVMEIWLSATIKTHSFISEEYWQRNLAVVRDTYLPQSNTILWEENGQIAGFVSLLDKTYIGGIFVDPKLQGKGIGSALMLTLQQIWPILSLRVYAKNLRAVQFYRRHGFKILMSEIDKNTGEEELLMYWSLGYLSIDDPKSHSSKPQC